YHQTHLGTSIRQSRLVERRLDIIEKHFLNVSFSVTSLQAPLRPTYSLVKVLVTVSNGFWVQSAKVPQTQSISRACRDEPQNRIQQATTEQTSNGFRAQAPNLVKGRRSRKIASSKCAVVFLLVADVADSREAESLFAESLFFNYVQKCWELIFANRSWLSFD
ncbi:UDP-glucosyl transferase 71B6, partial [Striga asiatica]